MATTSIWPISGNIQTVIKYVSNPDKTDTRNLSESDIQSLKDVMDYAVNPDKTEKQHLVSGINCVPAIAREQMLITKKRFSKLDGRTAYHAYQSFSPGETTPDQAHQIGMEFAQQLWGDRFQVVVATHIDKSHIHNHFVINSVSFMDGKKFHSTCESYFGQMRTLSDQLCRKYQLSVIENPPRDGRATKSHKEWQAEQDGKPTWRGLVREDIDAALLEATVWSQFISALKSKGYEIKINVKHIAVRPPGKERFIRLRSLGDEYTEEALRRRIIEGSNRSEASINNKNHSSHTHTSTKSATEYKSAPTTTRSFNFTPYNQTLPAQIRRRKRRGYTRLYIHLMYKMGMIRRRSSQDRRAHFLLREESLQIDRLMEGFHYIHKHRIDNYSELIAQMNQIQERMSELAFERNNLYKLNKSNDPNISEKAKAEIKSIRQQLSIYRKELKICSDIKTRSTHMTAKLQQIKTLNTSEQVKQQVEKEEHTHAKWR
ncbi:MAG: relaxase/mobilization nuclease domain-containing protein [Eubacteriales bacterium]|nr:relaxase/mobilization nuclease domain-containing protein [Eubacteriales bacterium]